MVIGDGWIFFFSLQNFLCYYVDFFDSPTCEPRKIDNVRMISSVDGF